MTLYLAVLFSVFFLCNACYAGVMTPITLPGIHGRDHTLPDTRAKATVLVFIADDCPISRGYAPEISRLAALYAPQGIDFDLVFAEQNFTPAEARTYETAYRYDLPAFTASWRTLVKDTGVTTTPEAAVLSPAGELLYRGRIDNLYANFGVYRQKATVHDLQNALDDILGRRPVRISETRAVGCYITL